MRYKCTLMYDGTNFHGFQIQDDLRTVQLEIENVLKIITKEPMEIPIFLAKITDNTSMPSIAPPKRIVRPLPIPDINPPKIAHKSRSEPARGETKFTSIGSTCMIRNETNE